MLRAATLPRVASAASTAGAAALGAAAAAANASGSAACDAAPASNLADSFSSDGSVLSSDSDWRFLEVDESSCKKVYGSSSAHLPAAPPSIPMLRAQRVISLGPPSKEEVKDAFDTIGNLVLGSPSSQRNDVDSCMEVSEAAMMSASRALADEHDSMLYPTQGYSKELRDLVSWARRDEKMRNAVLAAAQSPAVFQAVFGVDGVQEAIEYYGGQVHEGRAAPPEGAEEAKSSFLGGFLKNAYQKLQGVFESLASTFTSSPGFSQEKKGDCKEPFAPKENSYGKLWVPFVAFVVLVIVGVVFQRPNVSSRRFR